MRDQLKVINSKEIHDVQVCSIEKNYEILKGETQRWCTTFR